ncbi:MAG TPA: hypothetical protein VFF60_10720 [Candidatus Binatus sp.]|nr:hypothetical protein [Candidatus Binatus sp.]
MSSTPFLDFLKLIDKDADLRRKLYDRVVAVFKEYNLTAEQVRALLSADRNSIHLAAHFEWVQAHPEPGPGPRHDVEYGPVPLHVNPPNTWLGGGNGG